MIAKFRRSDGIEFEVDEGSASYELMQGDGAFTRVDQVAVPEKEPEVVLSKLNKADLVAKAGELNVAIDAEKMTKAQIIAAIEAAAEAAVETDEEGSGDKTDEDKEEETE